MTGDVIADLGHLFLGSRLKRLAERLQAGAGKAFRDAGYPVQPGQMPLLAALDRFGPLSVGAMVEALGVSQPAVTRNLAGLVALGLVTTAPAQNDRRQKTIALTPDGTALLAAAKAQVWPLIDAAVTAICAPMSGPLLEQVTALEAALATTPLDVRVAALAPPLELIDYRDDLAGDFARINGEWIEQMYTLEPTDRDVLGNPRARIIDAGGDILYVRAAGLGIVGACALMPSGGGSFELTKMGVLASARGRKAGEFLLAGMIARARQRQAAGDLRELYLLTNRKSEAAIHLYEKLGFRHSDDIMQRFGRKYARCNVAMVYPL
jgi:DNA-binding MarR family transcriptional regulator/ribosomal protein S18 acetylase RimI-like enzyme